MLKVVGTDNRDPYTTVLTLEDGSQVEINPVQLFRNTLENMVLCGVQVNTSPTDVRIGFIEDDGNTAFEIIVDTVEQ